MTRLLKRDQCNIDSCLNLDLYNFQSDVLVPVLDSHYKFKDMINRARAVNYLLQERKLELHKLII